METGQSSCEPELRKEEEAASTAEENDDTKGSSCIEDFRGDASTTPAAAAAASVVSKNGQRSGPSTCGGGSVQALCQDNGEVRAGCVCADSNSSAEDCERSFTKDPLSLRDEASGEGSPSKGANKQDDQSSDGPAPKVQPFAVGDHVYRYSSFFSLHQQHGVVLGVHAATKASDADERREDEEGEGLEDRDRNRNGGDNDDDDWVLLVFDFASWNPKNPNPGNGKTISTSSSSASRSCVRVYESRQKRDRWSKVEYGVSPTHDLGSAVYHHLFSRAGTFTTAQSSPAGWVCARVEFLRLHPDVLPPYSSISSNAECVAVWCKTGTWATLQATSLLSLTAMGQVKSTATIAGVVGTAQVTVPAAGMWGWLGYTSQVSLLSLHPVLVPAIAAYGVVTIGAPLAWLWRAKKLWKDLTVQLNERFWQYAIDEPDFFVRHVIASNSEDGTDVEGIPDEGAPLSLTKSFDQEWYEAQCESAGHSIESTPPRARLKSV